MDKKKLFVALIVLVVCSFLGVYKYFSSLQENYLSEVSNTYQSVNDIKENLLNACENGALNFGNEGKKNPTNEPVENTTKNFNQILDESKEKLISENEKLSSVNVPNEYSEQNKKILESLKIEYNLFERVKNVFSFTNEYEEIENFNKTKDTMISLKENSALLNVGGNNFEEIFDLSPVYEKIENHLKSKVQLRYEKDMKEQAEREAAAAAERERIERAKNTFYVGYRFFRSNQRISFSANDLTIKVGQTVHVFLEDSSEVPTFVRMLSTTGLWNNCSHYDDGNHGVVLTAKSVGHFNLEIEPEWNMHKTGILYINIVP